MRAVEILKHDPQVLDFLAFQTSVVNWRCCWDVFLGKEFKMREGRCQTLDCCWGDILLAGNGRRVHYIKAEVVEQFRVNLSSWPRVGLAGPPAVLTVPVRLLTGPVKSPNEVCQIRGGSPRLRPLASFWGALPDLTDPVHGI